MNATETERPRRYTAGEMARDALTALATRGPARQNSVRLTVQPNGDVLPEVTAVHDDLEEAERQALAVLRRLTAKLPKPEQNHEEPLKVGLTRNAKGETQISVEGRGAVAEQYETLRARYPLNDGTVSADKPKAAR